MEIGLFNQTERELDEYFVVIKKVLEHGLKKLDVLDAIFNVIIVDNNYIHELNRTYRNIDRETDVIYISIDKAISQSEEYGHSLERELCFLAVHGLLHLLGYDHMKKEDEELMFKLQEDILNEVGITR